MVLVSRSAVAPALACLLILAAFVLPPAAGESAGGTVTNALPGAPDAALGSGGSANTGTTEILAGEVSDANGEQDLKTLRIVVAGAAAGTFTYDVSAIDWAATTAKPAAFTAEGWKAWNCGGARDGTVCFEYAYTYNAAGSYTFVATGADGVSFGAAGADLVATVSDAIAIAGRLVLADGSLDAADARWGSWSTVPGASNVLAGNFLKVTNTGVDPSQEFTVDFTEAGFLGETDPTWSIAIDSNIQFACAETQTGDAPEDLVFGFAAVSPTGSATCAFTAGSAGGAGVMYVQYRIVGIPAPMMGQAYGASYTVSA